MEGGQQQCRVLRAHAHTRAPSDLFTLHMHYPHPVLATRSVTLVGEKERKTLKAVVKRSKYPVKSRIIPAGQLLQLGR